MAPECSSWGFLSHHPPPISCFYSRAKSLKKSPGSFLRGCSPRAQAGAWDRARAAPGCVHGHPSPGAQFSTPTQQSSQTRVCPASSTWQAPEKHRKTTQEFEVKHVLQCLVASIHSVLTGQQPAVWKLREGCESWTCTVSVRRHQAAFNYLWEKKWTECN